MKNKQLQGPFLLQTFVGLVSDRVPPTGPNQNSHFTGSDSERTVFWNRKEMVS